MLFNIQSSDSYIATIYARMSKDTTFIKYLVKDAYLYPNPVDRLQHRLDNCERILKDNRVGLESCQRVLVHFYSEGYPIIYAHIAEAIEYSQSGINYYRTKIDMNLRTARCIRSAINRINNDERAMNEYLDSIDEEFEQWLENAPDEFKPINRK